MKKEPQSANRFGVRYGYKVRHRMSTIEAEQRKHHQCPYCRAFRVRRLAVGIWACTKCKAKFTGKAYSVKKKIVVKKPVEEAPEVAPEEPKEVEA
ncbi:MAG: 50S ribosomal protein L37ae [Nanoarchaeota archaeon]